MDMMSYILRGFPRSAERKTIMIMIIIIIIVGFMTTDRSRAQPIQVVHNRRYT